MNRHLIITTAIRDTLLSFAAPDNIPLPDILKDGSNAKIYRGDAQDDMTLPYIMIQHITGGTDRQHVKSEATDALYEVVAFTANREHTEELIEFIGQLHRTMPVTTNVPAVGYDYFTELAPIDRGAKTQQNPHYQVGGMYRVRLSLD